MPVRIHVEIAMPAGNAVQHSAGSASPTRPSLANLLSDGAGYPYVAQEYGVKTPCLSLKFDLVSLGSAYYSKARYSSVFSQANEEAGESSIFANERQRPKP